MCSLTTAAWLPGLVAEFESMGVELNGDRGWVNLILNIKSYIRDDCSNSAFVAWEMGIGVWSGLTGDCGAAPVVETDDMSLTNALKEHPDVAEGVSEDLIRSIDTWTLERFMGAQQAWEVWLCGLKTKLMWEILLGNTPFVTVSGENRVVNYLMT